MEAFLVFLMFVGLKILDSVVGIIMFPVSNSKKGLLGKLFK